MYAYELEHVLARLFRKSDVYSAEDEKVAARFESLRRYNCIPQGRARRGERLTLHQVALAILGMTPNAPAWAGHSATCLQNLVPVGGPSAAWGAETLALATVRLLSDRDMRERLVRMTITGAESGVNVNGYAEVVMQDRDENQRAAFVHKFAFSSQTLGVELEYRFEKRHAASSREVSLNAAFFCEVADAYELSVKLNRRPKGGGDEYNAEEALSAFYKELGAGPRSRFLNVGIETSVEWPRAPCQFSFGSATLVALPPSEGNDASLHIDLHAHRISDREGRSLLSEALSIAVWLDDQMGMLLDGWSGNPVPVGVHRTTTRNPSSLIAGWCNSWQRVDDEKVRLLLGLYREARNLEMTHSIPYALLGYYRVFEAIWPTKDRGTNLGAALSKILSTGFVEDHHFRVLSLAPQATGQEIANLIYEERQKVAHAKSIVSVNPDVSDDLRRLSVAAHILRKAARVEMAELIGITTNRWSPTWRKAS